VDRIDCRIPTGTTSTTVTYGTWAVGGDLEHGITDNLGARVEYLHLDKNNIATGFIGPPPTQMTSHLEDNLVRAGAELPLSDHAIAARLLSAVALQR
jgi:opacity protein-like surface antigen